jgi:hypothetical protein
MFSLIFPAPRLTSTPSISRNVASVVATESQPPQKPARIRAKPRVDYSSFSHGTHLVKQKLSCDSCHKFPSKNWKEVRKTDTAFPDVADFPDHASCLNCHRAQFFARERPAPIICSNCHINVTPRDTTRFLFPSLGDVSVAESKRRESGSEFKINFPHDKHVDVVGFNAPNSNVQRAFVSASWQQKKEQATEPKSCPVCHRTHQPQGNSDEEYVMKPPKNLGDAFLLKKGTFKTTPNSHTTCFSCHNQELGIAPSPSDCNACHKLDQTPLLSAADFDAKLAELMAIADQTMLRAWGRRISSGSFRHEGGDHPNVSCPACHHVDSMNTLEAKTLKVQVKSCGGAEGCHITATTDDGGILNYEIDQKKANPGFVCTKCHISYGKQSVPESHVNAIPKATNK